MPESPTGKLIIVSGPSGAGKSSVVRKLLQAATVPLELSISATTRAPRDGEEDGVHYHFLSDEDFQRKRAAGEFLECKEVFGRGVWYGTFSRDVVSGLNAGKWMLLEIDVQGALSVLAERPEAVTFFIHPGSLEELKCRLLRRGSETPKSLARRLEVAREEMKFIPKYQHEIINDVLENTVTEMCQLLAAC